MKRALYCLAALLVLMVAGGAFALSRIDTATIRSQIAERTLQATGKALLLEEVPQISFMPLGLRFGAATWGMAAQGQDAKAPSGISASVKGGTVSLQWAPLFSGRILVNEVILQSPTVSIRPPSAAPQDQATPPMPAPKTQSTPPADNPASANSGASATPSPQGLNALPFELAKVQITNGTVLIDDASGQSLEISALNARITDLRPQAESGIQVSLHVALSKQTASPAAGAKPGQDILQACTLDVQTRLRQEGSRLIFQNTQVVLTPEKGPFPATAGPLRVHSSGSYALDSGKLTLRTFTASLPHSELSLKGEADTRTPSFAGTLALRCAPAKALQSMAIAAPLGHMPGQIQMESPVLFKGTTLDIPALKGTVDDTSLALALHLQWPLVQATVQLGELNLDRYLTPASAPEARAATTTATPTARARATAPHKAVSASPALAADMPSLDIRLNMAALTVKKLTLQHLQTHIEGTAGRYTAAPLRFSLASGGTVDTRASVDLPAQKYSLGGTAAQIKVGDLLRALQGKSPLNGTAHLEFSLACAGSSAPALTSSLSGKGLLSVRDITLQGASLIPRNTPGIGGAIPTSFEKFQAPFTIAGGTITSKPITLQGSNLQAQGQATVRLVQQDLDMQASIALPGITLPVVASGPFNHLSYGLDPRKSLQEVLRSPESLGKGAGSLLHKGGAGAEHLGGALKGLFGK